MDRIIGVNTIDLGGGRRGFRGKDTVAGMAGTELAATWHNAVQEEILAVIEKSGGAASAADLLQLLKAIRSQRLNYIAAVGGTANALTIALDPAPADWADLVGAPLRLRIASTNTAAATLAVAGLPGTRPIVLVGGRALSSRSLIAGSIVEVAYDGTSMQILSSTVSLRSLFVPTDFFTPGTWNFTVPAGVYQIYGETQAGGGGGGGALNANCSASGGGSGGFTEGMIDVTPGQVLSVIVGAGGPGGSAGGGNGGNGGSSSIGSSLAANGGAGGLGSSGSPAVATPGGAGGLVLTPGSFSFPGGGGSIGYQVGGGLYAGGTGAGAFRGQVSPITVNAMGGGGATFGSGGGGASANAPGGNGYGGLVRIYS